MEFVTALLIRKIGLKNFATSDFRHKISLHEFVCAYFARKIGLKKFMCTYFSPIIAYRSSNELIQRLFSIKERDYLLLSLFRVNWNAKV